MKVVIAIDSFKGSLSSIEAGNAVKEAVLKVDGSADVANVITQMFISTLQAPATKGI